MRDIPMPGQSGQGNGGVSFDPNTGEQNQDDDLPTPPAYAPLPGRGGIMGGLSRAGDGGGGGGGLPIPPLPQGYDPAARAPEAAGANGAPAKRGFSFGSLSPEVWQALTAAGLGIMGGRSHNALTNIGQGGLAGMEWAARNRLAQQQQDQNALYRQGMLANQSTRNDNSADAIRLRHEDRQAQMANATQMAMMRAMNHLGGHATEGDILAGTIKQLVGTPKPDGSGNYTQLDVIREAKGIDIRQQIADQGNRRLDQGDYRLDQGDQRIAQQQATFNQRREFEEKRLGRQLSNDETNQLMTQYRISKDFMAHTTLPLPSVPSAASRGAPTAPAAAAPPQFIEGKTYIDPKGNKAIYQGGQFVDVP